jgi:hypothetical protein
MCRGVNQAECHLNVSFLPPRILLPLPQRCFPAGELAYTASLPPIELALKLYLQLIKTLCGAGRISFPCFHGIAYFEQLLLQFDAGILGQPGSPQYTLHVPYPYRKRRTRHRLGTACPCLLFGCHGKKVPAARRFHPRMVRNPLCSRRSSLQLSRSASRSARQKSPPR